MCYNKDGDGMKKGFTLIELLAVIIIIGVVALIVFPTVMESIEKSKQDLYEIQIRDIEEAGRKWATDSMEYMDNTHLNTIGVSLQSLIDAEYLQKSNVQDPRDKTKMNGCVTILYDEMIHQYQYTYVESRCEDVITHGYFYTYVKDETGWSWKQQEKDIVVSSANQIINTYAANQLIKTEGQTTAGFYDEGERYVFRGDIVDNYVKLKGGNEVYRILSIDKSTGTMRIMGTTAIPNSWDSDNGVIFENASVTTAQLVSYFENSTNGIAENVIKINTEAVWNVGTITENTSYSVLKSLENGKTAYGKIGLPSISDYIGASTDLSCHDAILSDTCKQQNYLYELWKGKNAWTINTDENKVWFVNSSGTLSRADSSSLYYIYPVIELKNNVHITSGNGKSVSPYLFE